MKFRVMFKNPDADTEIEEEARKNIPDCDGDEEQKQFEFEDTVSLMKDFMKQWARWGETVTIEFDTESGTAKVMGIS